MSISRERVNELRTAAFEDNPNIASIFDDESWGEPMDEELLSFCEERSNTVLIEAISNCSIKFINALLNQPFTQHVNTNCRCFTHCTPLILCISKGWTHRSSYLSRAQSPLSEVAIRLVMEKKANVHGRDKYGRTALHYACLHRNPDAIIFLIRNGALWNTPDEDGLTPLDFIFFDYERAYEILYHVNGGPHFTLNKNNFNPDYDLNSLITALGVEVENKNSEENFVSKSQKNKERQKFI